MPQVLQESEESHVCQEVNKRFFLLLFSIASINTSVFLDY